MSVRGTDVVLQLVMFNLSTVNFLDQSGKYYKTPWRTVPEVLLSISCISWMTDKSLSTKVASWYDTHFEL